MSIQEESLQLHRKLRENEIVNRAEVKDRMIFIGLYTWVANLPEIQKMSIFV